MLKIYSLNTGLNNWKKDDQDERLDRWNAVWEKLKPKAEEGAVLVLQEVPDLSSEDFSAIKKDLVGYTFLFRKQKGPRGRIIPNRIINLVVAKPGLIKDVARVKVKERANRYLPFKLNVDDAWFNALAVHAHAWSNEYDKEEDCSAREVDSKLRELHEQGFEPDLVLGDFNAGIKLINGDPKDYKDLLKQYGFTDACVNEKRKPLLTHKKETLKETKYNSIDHILYRYELKSGPARCEWCFQDDDRFDHALICSVLSRKH